MVLTIPEHPLKLAKSIRTHSAGLSGTKSFTYALRCDNGESQNLEVILSRIAGSNDVEINIYREAEQNYSQFVSVIDIQNLRTLEDALAVHEVCPGRGLFNQAIEHFPGGITAVIALDEDNIYYTYWYDAAGILYDQTAFNKDAKTREAIAHEVLKETRVRDSPRRKFSRPVSIMLFILCFILLTPLAVSLVHPDMSVYPLLAGALAGLLCALAGMVLFSTSNTPTVAVVNNTAYRLPRVISSELRQ